MILEKTNLVKEYFPFYKLIEYKGKQIVLLDLSNMAPEDVVQNVPKTTEIMHSFPENSVLLLNDFRGMKYSSDSLTVAKEYSRGNVPYVVKSAMLGVTGLKKIGLKAMITFSGRKNMYPFDTEEEALDWLVA